MRWRAGCSPGRAGRLPAGDVPGGRGLWLAQHLTAGLKITAGPAGVSATVCLTPASSGATPAAGLTLPELADTDARYQPRRGSTP